MQRQKLIILLEAVINIAQEAAVSVMSYYHKSLEIQTKTDGSPVTQADKAAHQLITKKLQLLTSEIPVISEESPNLLKLNSSCFRQFWLVDPLDGSKEFINKNDEFSINIALIDQQKPVLGVISLPAFSSVYAGLIDGEAFKITRDGVREKIFVDQANDDGLIVLGSRSHNDKDKMDTFLSNQKIKQFISAGSALKFCRLAEGKAHFYPRLGKTMEWDTAAGHAILNASGGCVTQLDGSDLYYGKLGFENPHFIAQIKKNS